MIKNSYGPTLPVSEQIHKEKYRSEGSVKNTRSTGRN